MEILIINPKAFLTPWKSHKSTIIEDLFYLNAKAAGAVINTE